MYPVVFRPTVFSNGSSDYLAMVVKDGQTYSAWIYGLGFSDGGGSDEEVEIFLKGRRANMSQLVSPLPLDKDVDEEEENVMNFTERQAKKAMEETQEDGGERMLKLSYR